MVMRYHWGLGVGHVGMGASCSIEDSATISSEQTVSGNEGDESRPDPHILGLDQDGATPRGLHDSEHNMEDNSEGEDSSTDSGSYDNDSDESDSGSENLRQDRRKLDLYNMYGAKEKSRTSYD